jgi:endoglucanase
VPAPNATADEAYAQVRYAAQSLAKRAPNALVYLDGTHSAWLPVGECAFRLHRSGVSEAQGFAVNISNFQIDAHASYYGTWIAKCLYYATHLAEKKGEPEAFRHCPSQPATDAGLVAWKDADRWYVDNVDRAVQPGMPGMAHFVIDTSRNGRGPVDLSRYQSPPFLQPTAVIAGLSVGAWCNPPGTGVGQRPTADTDLPLLDAYLWIKTVGESDGSCDIAGGARAWDYQRYNPWGLTGDAQRHFDPLWGMVDPAAGTWFPEQALGLALQAQPPLVP